MVGQPPRFAAAEGLVESIFQFALLLQVNHTGTDTAGGAFDGAAVVIGGRDFVFLRGPDVLVETGFILRCHHKGIRFPAAAAKGFAALVVVDLPPFEFPARHCYLNRFRAANRLAGAVLDTGHTAVAEIPLEQRIRLQRCIGEHSGETLARPELWSKQNFAIADLAQSGTESGNAQMHKNIRRGLVW